MEAIAVLEILGRHGKAARIERVEKFPITLGRAYDNDVIIDDPYLAPHHIRIESDEKGFKAIDLGSKNGMRSIISKASSRGEIDIDSDTVLRLGHTQIRLRRIDYIAPPEQVLPPDQIFRNPILFFVSLLCVISWLILIDFLSLTKAPDCKQLLAANADTVENIFAWIIAWSVANKLLNGKGLFFLHGTIACIGYILYEVTERLVSLVAFSFSLTALAKFSFLPVAVVLGLIVYRHILLISRAATVSKIMKAFMLTLLLVVMEWAHNENADEKRWDTIEKHVDLWPNTLLVAKGDSIDHFFSKAEDLQQKAAAKRNDTN